MILKNREQFSIIILVSALILSFCAAYYSIIGIASLFAGATLSVGIMAASLELAKLITASYLFRFWKDTKTFLRTYLLIAIAILMVITSVGIFGYLSYAYQKSSIENSMVNSKIQIIQVNKNAEDEKISISQKRISTLNQVIGIQENRISDVLNNPMLIKNSSELKSFIKDSNDIVEKNRLDIEEENKRIQICQNNITKLNEESLQLQTAATNKKDIITFKFIADAFGRDINSIVKYFIILLMLVFDPLAICLLLAYNTMISINDVPMSPPVAENVEKPEASVAPTSAAPAEENKTEFKKLIRKPYEYCIRKMNKRKE